MPVLCVLSWAGASAFFVVVAASRPQKKILMGWVAYLLVVLALAYRIGGALLL